MRAKTRFSKPFINAILIAGLVLFAIPAQPIQAISDSLVISQFQVGGTTTADEFIEIHNVGSHAEDINGYKLAFRPMAGSVDTLLVSWSTSTIIPAGGFYLIAAEPGYDEAPPADITFNDGGGGKLSGSSGGLGLRDASNMLVDSVGYGSAINIFVETTPTPVPPADQSRTRLGDGCTDTDNNLNDFTLIDPSNPRNSSSAAVYCVPPDIAPAVSTTNPSNGATGVLTGANISIEFSEPVTIIPENFFDLVCDSVERSGTISGSSTSYTIDPSEDLPNDGICEVTIYAAAVSDQDFPFDQMAGDYEFDFTIAPVDYPPSVVNTLPVDDASGVVLASMIIIAFSEVVSMDAGFALVDCTSGTHTYTVNDSLNPLITLIPEVAFSLGDACSVTIDHTRVHDKDGIVNDMAGDYAWNFNTYIDPAPMVNAVSPLNSAIDIPLAASLTIDFSEPVDVGEGWYDITCAGSGTHSALVSGGPTSFTLDPDTVFAFGELCTITLDHTRISDTDSDDPLDGMISDYIWGFQVAEASNILYLSLIVK